MRWLAYGTVPLAAVGTAAVLVPVPVVDAFVAEQLAARLADQFSCPDDPTGRPRLTVKGDRLLLAALRRRLPEGACRCPTSPSAALSTPPLP